MLKNVILPLFADAYYSYSISLEGNSYILEFIYNERAELYYLNLKDAASNPIVLGAALVPNYPIMLDYSLPDLTGGFWLEKKSLSSQSEPYKTYPDKLNEYYDFYYTYLSEE